MEESAAQRRFSSECKRVSISYCGGLEMIVALIMKNSKDGCRLDGMWGRYCFIPRIWSSPIERYTAKVV